MNFVGGGGRNRHQLSIFNTLYLQIRIFEALHLQNGRKREISCSLFLWTSKDKSLSLSLICLIWCQISFKISSAMVQSLEKFRYLITTNGHGSLIYDSFLSFFLLKIVFLEEASQQEKLAKEWCFKSCEIRELSHQ